MNLSADEFLSLSTQLSDRDVRVVELEKQLEETRRLLLVKEGEVVALTQRLAEAEQIQQATEIENRYLKQYLWLSWTKIKHFMTHIHDIWLVAFLQDVHAEDGVGEHGGEGAGGYQRGGVATR